MPREDKLILEPCMRAFKFEPVDCILILLIDMWDGVTEVRGSIGVYGSVVCSPSKFVRELCFIGALIDTGGRRKLLSCYSSFKDLELGSDSWISSNSSSSWGILGKNTFSIFIIN